MRGWFVELRHSVGPAANTEERAGAYGGSKWIQREATEYLIPEVRTSWLLRF